MADSVFAHEFILSYEVAGTATSPPVKYVSHGRNNGIDLIVNRPHREEHILWTDDREHTCFCTLKMIRQDIEGTASGRVLCYLSVSLIIDRLSDFPLPTVVGVPYLEDHIGFRRLTSTQIEYTLRDEISFITGLNEERSFFLGASDRLSQVERGFRTSVRSKESIQYTGVLRPLR